MEHPTTTTGQAARIVRLSLERNCNVILVGDPGIGKTDIITQAASTLGWPVRTLHAASMLPEEPGGMPIPDMANEIVRWLPSGVLAEMVQSDHPLVIFLDDLGQGSPAVQATLMQWLLGHRVNDIRISDQVRFCAATNRKASNMGVSGLLAPVKGRFGQIVHVRPSAQDWAVWAIGAGMPLEGIAFSHFRAEYWESYKQAGDMAPESTPRTITRALEWFMSKPDQDLLFPLLANAAGVAWATEFLAFVRVWESLPDVDQIIKHPDQAPVPDGTRLDVLYAIATALAARATVATVGAIARYIDRLPITFGAIFVKDCVARTPALAGNGAITQWVTSHPELMS